MNNLNQKSYRNRITHTLRSRLPSSILRLARLRTLKGIKEVMGIYDIIKFPPPKNVVFEITNACNLNCIMCGYRHMKRKKGYMDLDFYKKMINEIRPYVKEIRLYSTGEPLLHPNLLDMINYAKTSDIKNIIISTNATMLNNELSQKLLSEEYVPTLLQFSVEGHDKETYEFYRDRANYQSVYNNIKQFYELRQKLNKENPSIRINLLINKKTDVDSFVRTWGRWCDTINVSLMYPPQFYETPDSIKEILFDVTGKYHPCYQPFTEATISYDHKLGACCGDFDFLLEMGDLDKTDLLDIWRNEEYQKLRKYLWQGKIEDSICKGCVSVYHGDNENERYKTQIHVNELMDQLKKT